LGFAQIFREKLELVKPEPLSIGKKTVNNSRGAFPPTKKQPLVTKSCRFVAISTPVNSLGSINHLHKFRGELEKSQVASSRSSQELSLFPGRISVLL
jgi:hypothetical protein